MSGETYKELMLKEARENVVLKMENSTLKDILVSFFESMVRTCDGDYVVSRSDRDELALYLHELELINQDGEINDD